MFALLKRVVLVALLAAVCYFGSQMVLAHRFAGHTDACTTEPDRKVISDARSYRLFFDVRKYFDDPAKWPFPIDEYRNQLGR